MMVGDERLYLVSETRVRPREIATRVRFIPEGVKLTEYYEWTERERIAFNEENCSIWYGKTKEKHVHDRIKSALIQAGYSANTRRTS